MWGTECGGSEVHRVAKQTRKTNPGDAANAFVRVILSDAGAMLGGLTEDEWRKTIEWFDGRCAYTGQALDEGELERDHAIPMNRTQCGLHLYGNVVPATKEANRRKAASAITPPGCRNCPASSGICEVGPGTGRTHGSNWDSSP